MDQILPPAMAQIIAERKYQISRWGLDKDKTHSKQDWATLIATYAGKVAGSVPPQATYDNPQLFARRVQQLGAICLAALEHVQGGTHR